MKVLQKDHAALIKSALSALHRQNKNNPDLFLRDRRTSTSAVLFLLGPGKTSSCSPNLILNKRSSLVPQPGDLCCPGGSISPRRDLLFSRFLKFKGTALTRWPLWPWWQTNRPEDVKRFATLFSTALREGFEEMGLNPLCLKLMGPLTPQRLILFNRIIYPMACWVPTQKKFPINQEVEKIINIPLENLMNPSNYALYRVKIVGAKTSEDTVLDLPCFIHRDKGFTEILWGATFRITMGFLEQVMGFRLPDTSSLPLVNGGTYTRNSLQNGTGS